MAAGHRRPGADLRRHRQRPTGRRPAPAGAAAAARVLRRAARHGDRDRPSPLAASRSRDGARARAGTDSTASTRCSIGFPGRCSRTRACRSPCTPGRSPTTAARRRWRWPMRAPSRGWPTDDSGGSKASSWSSTSRTRPVTRATRWSGLPPTSPTKTGQQAWVVFLGDDETDEDAFRAIDRGLGVLVGSRPTCATHQLDGISDVDTLLRWLTARK